MINTINLSNTEALKQGYSKRNAIYELYIEDIVYRALNRFLNRKDLSKILVDTTYSNFTMYKDTVNLAVTTKLKDLKNSIRLSGKDVLFTLEPANPLVESNIERLENIYNNVSNGYMTKISPVTKELSTAVANTSFDLLDFMKNKVGNYGKEYITAVKSIIRPVDENNLDKTHIEFLEVNPINELIIEEGVIKKYYSNNFKYVFDVNYDSADVIKAVLDTDYKNIDLNKFNMEIDTEFHKYLDDLEDDGINDFKQAVESFSDKYFSVKKFIEELARKKGFMFYDLQYLTYLWAAVINKYQNSKDKKYLEIAGYLEELINNTIIRIEQYKKNKLLAIGKKTNDEIYIYVILKEYMDAVEKNKNIIRLLKGYYINVNGTTSIKTKDLLNLESEKLLSAYDKYLANARYKEIISKISDLREAYVYGFIKTSKDFASLVNGYDNIEKMKKAIEAYVIKLKLNQLLEIEETVYSILKNILFIDLLKEIDSYISLGETKFPDDQDKAMMFAVILTLTEVTFSLFNIKILERVE